MHHQLSGQAAVECTVPGNLYEGSGFNPGVFPHPMPERFRDCRPGQGLQEPDHSGKLPGKNDLSISSMRICRILMCNSWILSA